MLRIGFALGRTNLRQVVGVLCFLSLSFVTAFHSVGEGVRTLSFGSEPALYAAVDHDPDASDQPMFDKCHLCSAIATSPSRMGGSDRDPTVPAPEVRLVAFQPAIIRPPPNA